VTGALARAVLGFAASFAYVPTLQRAAIGMLGAGGWLFAGRRPPAIARQPIQ
jgi:hypothetical protein